MSQLMRLLVALSYLNHEYVCGHIYQYVIHVRQLQDVSTHRHLLQY